MDGLEFTSKLIEHGAWPALVVYVAVTQKAGIATLLARMSKFKAPGLEAEFGAKTEAAAERIEERSTKPVEPPKIPLESVMPDAVGGFAPANADPVVTATAIEQSVLDKMFKDNVHQRSERLRDERLRASGLIIEEWANLEDTIRMLSVRKGFNKANGLPITMLLHELNRLGIISTETADSVRDLQKLRNQVAHTQIEPTREAAENFSASCGKVQKRIAEEEAVWQLEAIKLASEMIAELGKPK
jgi:hypothetical protein